MIASLKGVLIYKTATEAVIDVNGVGYQVNVSLTTSEQLGQVQNTVSVLTYLHVREDILQLYGFATEAERDFFRLLLSISGIGPKMAQGILSGMSTTELRTAIVDGNVTVLTTISGVGKKTAERIVIELRDKLSKNAASSSNVIPSGKELLLKTEAINALMSLGFQHPNAEKAVLAVMKEYQNQNLSVEEIIKFSLRKTT